MDKALEWFIFIYKRIIGLQEEVKAGDVIGYQGDSGNLKNGIKEG